MKIQAYRALARGVLLESLRRKDLWVVAILGFVIVAAAGALGLFGMSGLEAFAKDLSVSVLSALGAVLAIVMSCRLIPEEIKQRTLYPLLSRPISRFDLLFGKFVGAVLATWIGFLILAATSALALAIFGVSFEAIMVQYLFAKLLGLAVLCAVTMTLSLYMTPQAAATLSFILAFSSSTLSRALVLAHQSAPEQSSGLYKAIYSVLPQFSLFDFGGRVANIGWTPVPSWVILGLVGYAIVYSASMLVLGWAGFRKRAI
jgi:ABC-type transport system involved in multi-copper enzyme maturation permease subunit